MKAKGGLSSIGQQRYRVIGMKIRSTGIEENGTAARNP